MIPWWVCFLAVTGAAVIIVGVLLVVAQCVCLLLAHQKDVANRTFEAGMKHYADSLMQASWWFSEDEAVMHLIQGLADSRSPDDVRQKWRQERAQLKLKESQ